MKLYDYYTTKFSTHTHDKITSARLEIAPIINANRRRAMLEFALQNSRNIYVRIVRTSVHVLGVVLYISGQLGCHPYIRRAVGIVTMAVQMLGY